MTIRHGGTNLPPSRLCQCGHIAHVHRGHGHCRVASGCTCPRFVEQTATPALYPTRPSKGHER